MSKRLLGLVLVGALAVGCRVEVDEPPETGVSAAPLACGGNQCTASYNCSANPVQASCGLPVRNVFDGAGLIYTFSLGTTFPPTATWAAFALQHAPGFDKWTQGDPATVVANYLASSGGQSLKNWRQATYNAGLYTGVWFHFPEMPARAGQLMAAFVNQLKLDFAIIDDEGGWGLTQAQEFRAGFAGALDTASRNVARAMTDEPHHYVHFLEKQYDGAGYHFLPQTYAGDMSPYPMCWALGAGDGWSPALQHAMIGLAGPGGTRCDADVLDDLNDLGRVYQGLSGGFSFYGPPDSGGSWTGLMDWGVNNSRAATRAAVQGVVARRAYPGGGGCSNACAAGAKQCIDGDRYQDCGDFNGDGCTEWSSAYSCGTSWPGTVCSSGWCVSGCNETLVGGQQLNPGQTIRSCNGAATFAFQTDGNLVIYDRLGALWATGTNHPNPSRLLMQGDGNLVSYDTNGAPRWSSGTYGQPGAYVAMQGDCNLVIYNTSGAPVWASNSRCR